MQRFAFQQGANHAHGKAIARADGIDDVLNLHRRDRALFAVGRFKPCAIGTGFQHHRFYPVIQVKIGNAFRRIFAGQDHPFFQARQNPVRLECQRLSFRPFPLRFSTAPGAGSDRKRSFSLRFMVVAA
jgi:hypothetical protein